MKLIIFTFIIPMILFSEPIIGLEKPKDYTRLEPLVKELSFYLSNKKLTKSDILVMNRLQKEIDNYLTYNNKIKTYNNDINNSNSNIIILKKVFNSKIKNNVEINNSNLSKSNTGIVLESNIYNSTINNDIQVIDSTQINSNLGVEIQGRTIKDNQETSLTSNKIILESTVEIEDSYDFNSNTGNYVGN